VVVGFHGRGVGTIVRAWIGDVEQYHRLFFAPATNRVVLFLLLVLHICIYVIAKQSHLVSSEPSYLLVIVYGLAEELKYWYFDRAMKRAPDIISEVIASCGLVPEGMWDHRIMKSSNNSPELSFSITFMGLR